MSKENKAGKHVVASNRKAHFNYDLEDRVEAGLVLIGSEIKSIRDHHVQLVDGYVQDINGELWLMGVNVARYDQASVFGHDPVRPRKLLLHKAEINRLLIRVRERGYSIVPTEMYLKDGKAKVEIALAKGRKQHDKRQAIGERDAQRDIQRALKEQG